MRAVRRSVGVIVAVFALGCAPAGGGARAEEPPLSAAKGAPGVLGGGKVERRLARLIPGKSTKSQVLAVLGQPWRTVQYNDLDALEDEIWEYRVIEAGGSYRVHIEFDHHDVVKIVGKIPDAGSGHDGTPARSAP
jgi:hypothetical protein